MSNKNDPAGVRRSEFDRHLRTRYVKDVSHWNSCRSRKGIGSCIVLQAGLRVQGLSGLILGQSGSPNLIDRLAHPN